MARAVIGLHFICRGDLNVTRLPDGHFDTGNWKVDAKHLATVQYVALHARRDELSYLQGDLVGFERSSEEPDRFVLRVHATSDALEWPTGSGRGEKGYRWSGDAERQQRAPNSLMFECDVKLLFKIDGVREWRWVTRPATSLSSGRQSQIRCAHCHGAVRIHKQRVPHGPADHVEHLRREDAVNCRGGDEFCGTHQPSKSPVE